MKRKLLFISIISMMLFTSCNNNNISAEPEWHMSSTMHWQEVNGEKINQGTHRYSDWIIESEPTCIKEGNQYKECLVCGYKKNEVIPTSGHDYGDWINEGETSYRTCSICGDIQETIREESITFKNLYNGKTIDLCDPVIRDLINHKDDDEYVATHHMNYRYCSSGTSYDCQTYVNIEIIDSKIRNANYTLSVSTDSEFVDIVDQYITTHKSIRLDGILLPGTTYYYKVDVDDGDYSKIDSFKTIDSPVRFINAGGIQNFRDIGGWEAEDGKHIKYGQIYRGAGLNDAVSSMDTKGLEIMNKLHMKAELDLREGASSSNAWDVSLPHLCVNGGWYTSLISENAKIIALKQSLDFLANSNNYPSYFHCSFGMDRTGTLSYILLGMLGVSETDLYLEYELSDYSSVTAGVDSHCERAVISQLDEDRYTFDYGASSYPDGTNLRTPIYKCIKYFKDNYKADTLQESITKYLTERVGVTITTIEKLKSNLLA